MGTIQRANPMKPFTYEAIEIGDEYGPVVATITDFQIKSHGYAVDDFGEWYLRDSPFGGRVGHPTLLADDIRRMIGLGHDRTVPGAPVGLHCKNDMEFLRPIRLGQEVTLRARTSDKYEKRGARYRVMEGEAVDAEGQPLVKMRNVELFGFDASTRVGQRTGTPPADAITGQIPADAPLVTRASREVLPGSALPSLVKCPGLEQNIIFSGFPWSWVEGGAREVHRNYHTYPEDSRRRGQPDAVVQGLLSAAYLSEICTEFFGASWFTTGRLSTSFIAPVIVRDVLTASAVVKRRVEEGAQLRLELDVWCTNQRGELVTVGRAGAQVQSEDAR